MKISMKTTLDDMVRTLRRLAHRTVEQAAIEKQKERARRLRTDVEKGDAGSA